MLWASLVAQMVKRLPAVRETRVQSLGCEDPLEKEMAAHSSTVAWKIPWTEEPDGLQSMGSQVIPPSKFQVGWENKCRKWNYQKETKASSSQMFIWFQNKSSRRNCKGRDWSQRNLVLFLKRNLIELKSWSKPVVKQETLLNFWFAEDTLFRRPHLWTQEFCAFSWPYPCQFSVH